MSKSKKVNNPKNRNEGKKEQDSQANNGKREMDSRTEKNKE